MKNDSSLIQSNESQHTMFSLEERERERQQRIEINRKDSIPVLQDLARAGFELEWISDLNRGNINYKDAVPILLYWLPRIKNVDIKETIVRTLTVSWAKPIAAKPLIEEFIKYGCEEESGIKWAIANALSVVADDSVLMEIVELLQDRDHGRSRQMLALALGKMKDPRAEKVLLELLKNDEIAGHAIIGLGKLRAKSAVTEIKKYLNHPQTWVRHEAKKALKRIEKTGSVKKSAPSLIVG